MSFFFYRASLVEANGGDEETLWREIGACCVYYTLISAHPRHRHRRWPCTRAARWLRFASLRGSSLRGEGGKAREWKGGVAWLVGGSA